MRDRRVTWAHLFGAICPARGVGCGLILPTVNIDAMNRHLAEISTCVSKGAIAVLVIDGAGWHRSSKLIVPDNIVLLQLPPYSPELSPVENIWQYLRPNHFAHQVWETYEAILDACCDGCNTLMNLPEIIRSIGKGKWAEVRI